MTRMSRATDRMIFLGMRGSVVALDRATGAELWKTPLKGGSFVNVVRDGADLIAATRGEVFCLDPTTGRVRWNNPMRGFGYGIATVAACEGSSHAAIAQHLQEQEAAASSDMPADFPATF